MPRSTNRTLSLQRVPEGQSHPYKLYQDSPLWKAIDRAVTDLVGNQDLIENEYHEYIVGYICKVVDRRRVRILAHLRASARQ